MIADRDTQELCPQGTYNPGGATGSLMCVPCPAGQSCLRKNAATD